MKILSWFIPIIVAVLLIFSCSTKNASDEYKPSGTDQDTIHVSYPMIGDMVSYPCNPGDTVQVICTSAPGGILYIPCINGTVVACQDTIH